MSALTDSKTRTMDDRGIRSLFTEAEKYRAWLEMEATLATAQSEAGIIPVAAARHIVDACRIENIDISAVNELQKEIGHGFVPFLKMLIKACPDDSGKYVHYGVTTQNIQQSAQLFVAKKVHEKFKTLVEEILQNLAQIALREADTVLPGRTHGRHAIPVTFGFKAAVWIDEFQMALERMTQCESRVFRLMMGGAVGAFNSSGEAGRTVQRRMAERLKMTEMRVPSRNIATHKVEYVQVLSLLASCCHKIAEEVYSTSLEEIAELSEGFSAGTIGSSTMPHKVNPKLAKGIIANAQKMYSLSPVMLNSCCRPYEADSSSYMLLEATFTEALELMTEIILRAEELTRTLHVNRERMQHNAGINNGLDNSELIMMKLAAVMGKDKAHEKMYSLAMRAIHDKVSFSGLLYEDPDISGMFSVSEISALLRAENYTGLSSTIAREVAGSVIGE